VDFLSLKEREPCTYVGTPTWFADRHFSVGSANLGNIERSEIKRLENVLVYCH